jgi:RNA polymerase sigma-70 factor (ECF subfamily)
MAKAPADDGLEAQADSWAELLRRATAGDDAALHRLLAEIRPYLKAVVERRGPGCLPGPADASDVVQDCLIAVWQHGGQVRGTSDGQVRRWLRVLAEHGLLDALRFAHQQCRDAGRQLPLPQDSGGAVRVAGDAPSPSQEAMRREDRERLERARRRLPADDQAVLRLHFDEGLDWPEVAARLGRKLAAVQRLYYRAVKRWKKLVEGEP